MNNLQHRPLLIYDGDCHFCRLWVDYWQSLTGDRVVFAPFQEVAENHPEIPRGRFEKAVHLITPEGEVMSGAHAVFRALACIPGRRWMLLGYERVPGFKFLSEFCYRRVADHRSVFSRLARLLWGERIEQPSYVLGRWVFLRLLGIIYLIAFLSLWTQVDGLIGHRGILPVEAFLSAVREAFGIERYWVFPTLAWLSASNAFLHFLCFMGALSALLLFFDIAPVLVLILAWVSYLSLVTAGQDFMGFQWDSLLLETGFLSIFLAPLRIVPNPTRESPPRKRMVWLLRWLLFRLVFSSGVVKLASGDEAWRDLTALQFHYEMQPLPTPIAWYIHQLPGWFHRMSAAGMFFIELMVPFFIFLPRRLRFVGAVCIIFLQTLIVVTGNYTFFNILTIALCLLLFDDALWRRVLPKRVAAESEKALHRRRDFREVFTIPLIIAVIFISGVRWVGIFERLGYAQVPKPALKILQYTEPFRVVNSYGLFAVMTKSRPEIIVEGSNDGKNWLAYEFKYKPGDVKRPPPWVAPHQPRLDWQMWFAALDDYRNNPWFIQFMIRLLEGSPPVLALLEKNPFPLGPPRFIRAVVYDYHFTHFTDRNHEGAWWQREEKGIYFPVSSLNQ